MVRTSPSALAERFQRLTGHELRDPLHFQCEVDLSRGPGAAALRLVRFVVSELEDGGPNAGDAAYRSSLEELLLSALLRLPHSGAEILEGEVRGRVPRRLVRIAEEYMEARAGERTSITDLLAVCGCSRSVLFEAFRRFRDYTPMQFLSELRIQKARRLLSSESGHTVTTAALDSGFTHLGRFAVAYRQRFGESPSETRKRTRRLRVSF